MAGVGAEQDVEGVDILGPLPMSRLQISAVATTVGLNGLDGFDVLAISFASPGIAKPLTGLGAGVWELAIKERGNAFRVVAPDLIGFGKSDKPSKKTDYSYARHVGWMRQWVEALDLSNMTLACQDWGSLIGLRLVAEMPDRFAAVALSNGGLPEGGPPPRAFAIWRAFSKWSPIFPIGRIVNAGAKRALSASEIAAYDAPFPNSSYKAGARIFPSFVPFEGNVAVPDQKRAWQKFDQWDKPFLCCFSDSDPITRGGENLFFGRVPGTVGQPHRTLKGGHFIQENDPQGFVQAILEAAKQ